MIKKKKGMDMIMKKIWRNVLLTALAVVISCGLWSMVSSAAGNRRCYTILNNNTPVYSNTGLTSKYGTIFGSDEISVITVTGRYTKVTYPISGGRTKTGYISTNAILWGTTGNTYTSRAKITTYKRPGGASYGYVATGDRVVIRGSSGGYTQVKYPVSGGFKYGFISTDEANRYIKGDTAMAPAPTAQTAASFQMPLDNARCTWRSYSNWSWGNNRGGSGRVYHLGIDIIGSNDNVRATANGTVAAAGWNNANGNYVVLKHNLNGQTFYSFYAHLSRRNVSKGASVGKGATIGNVGNTGSASGGKHLHFAMMNSLWAGSYYGYATYFSGNKTNYSGVTYYNPVYVINNSRLP